MNTGPSITPRCNALGWFAIVLNLLPYFIWNGARLAVSFILLVRPAH